MKMTRTYLAYALEDGYCMFEKANVKDGNDELNVGIVANAIDGIEPAGLAERVLF
jgi:hypothetical protein